jgi:alpha-tubulin suppressor-like RCC1 family protein
VNVGDNPNDATSIALGIVHSCARRATGIVCWGQNVLQQLGDGSGADQALPVSVVGF